MASIQDASQQAPPRPPRSPPPYSSVTPRSFSRENGEPLSNDASISGTKNKISQAGKRNRGNIGGQGQEIIQGSSQQARPQRPQRPLRTPSASADIKPQRGTIWNLWNARSIDGPNNEISQFWFKNGGRISGGQNQISQNSFKGSESFVAAIIVVAVITLVLRQWFSI
ncbi:hypothetical protein F5B18DRAFT_516141 [Nemania serpens]|nr:hypothetical protein F5B18DRAFT_516141 [Nemania serpens]